MAKKVYNPVTGNYYNVREKTTNEEKSKEVNSLWENEEKPFFSVIIPTNRADEKTERAINSVLNQTYKSFEIIVVLDDVQGENLPEDNRITYIKSYCHSPAKARNQGIMNAKGSYLVFLDCDNWFHHKYLEMIEGQLYVNDMIVPSIRPGITMDEDIFLGYGRNIISKTVIRNRNVRLFNEKLIHNEDKLFILENIKNLGEEGLIKSNIFSDMVYTYDEGHMRKNKDLSDVLYNNPILFFEALRKRLNISTKAYIIFVWKTLLEVGGMILRKIGVWK